MERPGQFLVILLNMPSFPSQLFLPPSLNSLPVIEPLSDPFIDEFEFGGVDQESEDEASIPYPAEIFEDHRFLKFISASNLLDFAHSFLLLQLFHQVSVGSHPLLP